MKNTGARSSTAESAVPVVEEINAVLSRLSAIDKRQSGRAETRPLRNAVGTAYRQLLLSSNDQDGTLRSRLDLIRGFAYPTYSKGAEAIFPSMVGRATGYAPPVAVWMRPFVRNPRTLRGFEFHRHLSGLAFLLSRNDVRELDEVELASYKRRIDSWVEKMVSHSLRQDVFSTAGLVEFQEFADQAREGDPMTRPGSVRAAELEAKSIERGIDRALSQERSDGLGNPTPSGSPDEVLAQVKNAVSEVEDIRLRAENALDATRQAAGQAGEVSLGANFALAGIRNGRVAAMLSANSIAALILACGLGVRILGGLEDIDLLDELAKLALTLPIFAVAAYLGRLSSHYREAARWAQTAAIQLMSVDAFAEGLSSEEQRDELKLALGVRVFGDPGFGVQAKNPDVADVVAIIDSVGNAVRPKE